MRRKAHLAIAALLGLALVETGLRWGAGLGDPPLAVLDDALEYRHLPSASYRRFGNEITINALGLRGPEIGPAPPADRARVLLIGDSVVYGTHHLDQAETLRARLEARMDCGLEAVPVAVSSWGPLNQLAWLTRHGTLGAHHAVVVLSTHDLWDTPRASPDFLPYRLQPSHTAIGDALTALRERLARRYDDSPRAPRPARRAEVEAALAGMLDVLARAGVPVTVLVHPTIAERATGPNEAETTLARIARDGGARVLNARDTGAAARDYRDDIHPAATGADGLAALLADDLTGRLPGC